MKIVAGTSSSRHASPVNFINARLHAPGRRKKTRNSWTGWAPSLNLTARTDRCKRRAILFTGSYLLSAAGQSGRTNQEFPLSVGTVTMIAPVYFFELRDSYVCSWCELHDSDLILVPSHESGRHARHIRYPNDVTVVGRVTALSMRIAEAT